MAGVCDTFVFLSEQEIIAKVKSDYGNPNLPIYYKCSKVPCDTLQARYRAFFEGCTRIIERIQYDVIFYSRGVAVVILVRHDAGKCSHFVHPGLFKGLFFSPPFLFFCFPKNVHLFLDYDVEIFFNPRPPAMFQNYPILFPACDDTSGCVCCQNSRFVIYFSYFVLWHEFFSPVTFFSFSRCDLIFRSLY